MKTFFVIPLDIYSRSCVISIGQSDQELIESFELEDVPLTKNDQKRLKLKNGSHGRGGVTKGNDGIIRLAQYDDKDPFLRAVFAHEVHHCVSKLLFFIGMTHCEESEEAYAYLVGYIHQEFTKHILG